MIYPRTTLSAGVYKLMAGEELVNNDPHDVRATDSVGFCFLLGTIRLEKNGICRHRSPNDAIRFLAGIVFEKCAAAFSRLQS